MNILAIAGNTFRESARDRIFYVLLVFAIVMLLCSKAIGWIGLDEAKITLDFSLTIIWFFGVIIAIYVGTGLVHKEIDKRTIYTVLSKPVEKYEFIVGKYIGLLMMLFINILIMGVIFLAYHWLTLGRPGLRLPLAVFMIYLELAFITAMAMMFGSMASPILSAVFTFCMFLAGHFSDAYMLLVKRAEKFHRPVSAVLFRFLYWVMPNLTFFDIKSEAVHPTLPLYAKDILLPIAYCIIYSTILLIVSLYFFKRRNF
ncbi:MAG: ABC transporter permease subunit [Planctomycetes bacterium]|nr:ABC transporter permease subunit [Planctomycetota bacterium]